MNLRLFFKLSYSRQLNRKIKRSRLEHRLAQRIKRFL